MYREDKLNDEELFKLVKENNSNALKALFLKYYENLCYFSYSYVKDQITAEEAVSDIFVNLWEKRKRIVITGNLKTYLYTSVRNQSLNYVRRNKLQSEKLDSVDQIIFSVNDGPEDKVNYDDLRKIIDGLIDNLPEKRKLIFQMNKFDELSYKEIAEILSISESTVKNQMMKAVQYLNTQYPLLRVIYPK